MKINLELDSDILINVWIVGFMGWEDSVEGGGGEGAKSTVTR